MTKREMEEKIEKLEKKIEELKSKPTEIHNHYHYHYDSAPIYPYYPLYSFDGYTFPQFEGNSNSLDGGNLEFHAI